MEQKPTCAYCGNNPVPHFLTWYNESLNVVLAPLRRLIFYNQLTDRLFFPEQWKWAIVRFFHALGIISYQTDIAKCKVRRAQVLWEEADKRGHTMVELLLFGKQFDTYVVQKLTTHPRQVIVFSGLPKPKQYNGAMLDVIDDKSVFKDFLQAAGLPVARGVCARSFRKAKAVFEVLEKPVIVKPRAGSRGRHSTTFVHTIEDLKKAFYIAKQLCSWVIVEEHLVGPVYRATLVKGELVGVLRGDPPQVTGDGIHTIEELVTLKNADRHLGVKDILLDGKAERFLDRQGLAFATILPKGQTVDLLEKIGVSYGGSSSEDIEICHPDNRELFIRAAQVLKGPVLGFDFIIPDITKSYKQQRCGFLEVNTLPFINLHHDPLKGPPQNVAAKVWDMVGW